MFFELTIKSALEVDQSIYTQPQNMWWQSNVIPGLESRTNSRDQYTNDSQDTNLYANDWNTNILQ